MLYSATEISALVLLIPHVHCYFHVKQYSVILSVCMEFGSRYHGQMNVDCTFYRAYKAFPVPVSIPTNALPFSHFFENFIACLEPLLVSVVLVSVAVVTVLDSGSLSELSSSLLLQLAHHCYFYFFLWLILR